MSLDRRFIAVIGGGREGDPAVLAEAEAVGRRLAEAGAVVVTGGLGGVMEAASRGARLAGGTVVGILPGNSRSEANAHVDIPICTGFGTGRNIVIVRTADAFIAVGGAYGTLSEIAHALQHGKPVIGIGSWDIRGVKAAENAGSAVDELARNVL